MATRTIYLNPGDVLRVRTIIDAELPKTESEWSCQIHRSACVFVVGPHGQLIGDPLINRDLEVRQNTKDHTDTLLKPPAQPDRD